MNHLARLRLHKPHLSGQSVDALRLRQLRLSEAQLAILLAQLLPDLLLRLDPIAALDGAEMLQAINHGEREKNGNGGGEDTHLPGSRRIGRLDHAAIVKVLGKKELRRVHAPPAQGLLGYQFCVLLGHPRAPASARFIVSCCACRHGFLPELLAFSSVLVAAKLFFRLQHIRKSSKRPKLISQS